MPYAAPTRRDLLKGFSALVAALAAQAATGPASVAAQQEPANFTVSIDLKDFMDGTPLDDAEITAVVNIVPRFRPGLPVNLPGRPPLPAPAVQYSEAAIRRITQSARRVAAVPGRYSATIPTAVLRSAMAELNGLGSSVLGRYIGPALALSLRIRCRTLEQEVRYFAGLNQEDGSFLLSPDGAIQKTIAVDFAKAIVGHVSTDTAVLWFCLHGAGQEGDRFRCVLRPSDPAAAPARVEDVFFDPARANTAVVTVAGLEPETAYRFELQVVRAGAPASLASGSLKTAVASTDRLAVAFASCHEPANARALNRWQELAGRDDCDLLLLMGDQMYGDAIKGETPERSYYDQYVETYHQYWKYWPMREVLRHTPTYMVLDDHEANDDWGTLDYSAEFPPEREQAAVAAYRAFQQPLHAGSYDGPVHYSFNRGPAAFFMMDSRTARSPQPEGVDAPILGDRQLADLRAWAERSETRAADVIFFIAPVPVAWLPVETMRRLIDQLQSVTRAAGAIASGLAGYTPAGGVGAYAGAAAGGLLSDGVEELAMRTEGLSDFTRWDLADQWTYAPNQRDLVHVLDVLFALANDIQPDGSPGPKPRAVFILGGDVHSGAMHVITSAHREAGREHARNPFIYQLTSSAISNEPASEKIYAEALGRINLSAAMNAWDSIASRGDRTDLMRRGFGASPVGFFLDDQGERAYAAELLEFLTTRSYGRIAIERLDPVRRRYRFTVNIQGEEILGDQARILRQFGLDLDAPEITPVEG